MTKRSQPDRRPAEDGLQSFTDSLREHVPTREALLAEAKAMTRKRRTVRRSALAVLLGSAVLGSLWHLDPAWQIQDVRVAIGQREHLQLADGSQVDLDSGSHLRIEKRLRTRQLELVQGQAQFNVVHAEKPFIVRSQGVRILDIGTVFDVRSDRRGVVVGVIEGAVQVSSGATASQHLVAGQRLHADMRHIGAPHAVDLNALTAWQQGKLRFNGAPLSEVIVDIQRYRQAPISVADARTGALRLSGEYDSNAVDTLLQLLPSILPVHVNTRSDGSLVISAAH